MVWLTRALPLSYDDYLIFFAVLMKVCSMLRDVDHLIHKLGNVEGFHDLGTDLIRTIKSKRFRV